VASAHPPRQGRPARLADGLLDLCVVAFAAWTVIYHLCAVLGVGATWATAAWVLVLGPAAWLALRVQKRDAEAPDRGIAPALAVATGSSGQRPARRSLRPLLAVNVLCGVAAALLFAFTSAPWVLMWLLWVVAAAAALAWSTQRPAGGPEDDCGDAGGPARAWLEPAVAVAWALGLAVLSLFLVGPDADDAYYVHLSSWIAGHGVFPLRDVAFSDQVFPALYFPPASSYEALVGAVAHTTSLAVPDLVYLVVPPVGSFLSVLALWRLLRTWRVPTVAVALSLSLLFLLFAATQHNTLGAFFVARMWQGKVLFLTILVPLLFVLLQRYAEEPTRRRLVLPALAGAAGVGLTTTAIFVVPIVATGCLAPLALRSVRRAALGIAAAAAYPVGAGALTLVLGGRTPDVYTDADVIPRNLVHLVLGTDVIALVAVTALLLGPLLLRRATSAQVAAATVLLVGCLVAPRVPAVIFHLTGLGRVLWRLTWVLPTAALVGAMTTGLATRLPSPLLRALPAVAVAAALVLGGRPLWSVPGETHVAHRPSWKRPPAEVAAARPILAHARPGDVILAPRPLSMTLLIMSGDVTTVSPRGFYTAALRDVTAAHVPERGLLQRFAGLAAGRRTGALPPAAEVRRALRAVGVDLACVPKVAAEARRVIESAGYAPAVQTRRLVCLRGGARS
jgi:hypothetical protein